MLPLQATEIPWRAFALGVSVAHPNEKSPLYFVLLYNLRQEERGAPTYSTG